MDRVFSPWRGEYIRQPSGSGGAKRCIFCAGEADMAAPDSLLLGLYPNSVALLNLYPYNNGHLMVVPYAHVPGIDLLTPEVRFEMIEMVNQAITVLREVYQPDGFNIGVNMGEAAGAGIAEHAHIHVVPRWAGDTSFISTVGETRVIPENLEVTFRRISSAWK